MEGQRGRGRGMTRKTKPENGRHDASRMPLSFALSRSSSTLSGERTVKRLRLSRALTMPENATVFEACRRMAVRRVDAALLTDSNALLCGILTDKDVALRVVACELKLDETPASEVMTRNPTCVLSDSLAVDALQKMVHGKFRHLPVVENGEVIALLDIAKCLYDAIGRMEKAAEKGKAIATAVEGVEKQWGASISGTDSFIESLRTKMFSPSLFTIIPEDTKFVTVSTTDSVLATTKKMLEVKASAAIITVDQKPLGILTPRDILMRVVSRGLGPNSTLVEKVMTANPVCATVDTPIVDALHTMHNGKFLHLPVLGREGNIVSVLDVIHVAHAAITTVGRTGVGNEATSSMLQNFWESAMSLGPLDDDSDSQSEGSSRVASEVSEMARTATFARADFSTTFGFKLEDKNGRMHRFNCDVRSITELVTAILQRVGGDVQKDNLPHILYEDADHDLVVLASDSDLAAAVEHARLAGWKSLRLYLNYDGAGGVHRNSKVKQRGGGSNRSLEIMSSSSAAHRDIWTAAYSSVAAGAAFVAGIGVMAYLKRAG